MEDDLQSLARNVDGAANLLSALANAKRLEILQILLEGEFTVGELAQKVAMSQSSLSQHLAKLRLLDLVEARRDAQWIYYSCRSRAVHQLVACLMPIVSRALDA